MQNPALPVASTEAQPPEPKLLGLESEGWVYVGLTLFFLIAIVVAKAPKRVAEALDKRIADAKRELEEARSVRAEAEALLADAQARQTAAADDARAILHMAQQEASEIIAKATSDTETLVERRRRIAEDKIAAAERTAVNEIRAHAARVAAEAAAKLIAERHDAAADHSLVDRAIAGLGQRTH